jgi:hypothetical protein
MEVTMFLMRKKAAAVIAALALTGAVFAQDCKPSKWGPNDEIGAANYITPQRVLAATQLVKMGQTHPLGIVIEPGMPAFPPRSVSLQIVSPGQNNGRDLTKDFGWPAVYNDDLAQLWFGVGPQLDGLGHLGEKNLYYNCNHAFDFVTLTGLTKLGTDKVPPMVARGVLIDMAKHFKVDAMAPGQPITADDIDAAMKDQGVTISEGDVVLFHTGYTDAKLKSDPKTWVSTEPGLTNAASCWGSCFLCPRYFSQGKWHLYPGNHEYGSACQRRREGVHVRPWTGACKRDRADADQSGCNVVRHF